MDVEINNLSEPVEPVPMDELSIGRYVESSTEEEQAKYYPEDEDEAWMPWGRQEDGNAE